MSDKPTNEELQRAIKHIELFNREIMVNENIGIILSAAKELVTAREKIAWLELVTNSQHKDQSAECGVLQQQVNELREALKQQHVGMLAISNFRSDPETAKRESEKADEMLVKALSTTTTPTNWIKKSEVVDHIDRVINCLTHCKQELKMEVPNPDSPTFCQDEIERLTKFKAELEGKE